MPFSKGSSGRCPADAKGSNRLNRMNLKSLLHPLPGLILLLACTPLTPGRAEQSTRLRLIVETDAGGDPDDEQSLVRFLLYANEWDVEAIIANRARCRDGENWNRERTGPGVVRQLVAAYGLAHSNLVQHDPRYPAAADLQRRTLSGTDDRDDAVRAIIAAVDGPDPRPIWYSDWGTDSGGATNNLRRALDRIWLDRGPEGYARFKEKIRLTSYDVFGPHTRERSPPFKILVNTFQPPLDGKRWYHRFSALTSKAGGFDLMRDVVTGHGPLGALYPTNTTHWAKEGDSMTFIYLLPNGLNAPDEPGWGGWAGRYGPNTNFAGNFAYWANQRDSWNGSTNRDNTLARWAVALQNDFRVRLEWCVRGHGAANHPPAAKVSGALRRRVHPGETVELDARESSDPDGQELNFEWIPYPEASGYEGPPVSIEGRRAPVCSVTIPKSIQNGTLHVILAVTDSGTPALTRYQRAVLEVAPPEKQ